MKTAKEYIDFLISRGYKVTGNQFLDMHLIYTDLEKNDTQNRVVLFTEYTEKYLQELKLLPEGTEFEIDFSKVEVTGAYFKSVITYPEKNRSFSDTGIIIEGQDFIDYFEKALRMSENPSEYEIYTMKDHIINMEYFQKYFKPILQKYDFYECYDSFWDISERYSSSPRFDYRHVNTRSSYDVDFIFSTNILSGKLKCTPSKYFKNSLDICSMTPEEFEESLLKYFETDDKFEYILDPDPNHTKDSYINVRMLYCNIMTLSGKYFCGKYDKSKIDFSKIPEKYKAYIKEYYDLLEKENEKR